MSIFCGKSCQVRKNKKLDAKIERKELKVIGKFEVKNNRIDEKFMTKRVGFEHGFDTSSAANIRAIGDSIVKPVATAAGVVSGLGIAGNTLKGIMGNKTTASDVFGSDNAGQMFEQKKPLLASGGEMNPVMMIAGIGILGLLAFYKK